MMHCKVLCRGGLGCLQGAGQSLVGLFLSDRTVRQGLDTSQRGKGGEGEEEKEKGGRRRGRDTMLWLSWLLGPCTSGVTGWVVGDKEKKTTQASGSRACPHLPHRPVGWLYSLY